MSLIICILSTLILFLCFLILSFKHFKSKNIKTKIEISKEVLKKEKDSIINPIYDDVISDLKSSRSEMIRLVSELPPISPLNDMDKKIIIKNMLKSLPSSLKHSVQNNSDYVFLYASNLNIYFDVAFIKQYGGEACIFNQIADDIVNILKEVGIFTASYGRTGSFISTDIKDLMKFCKYDELILLK